MKHLFNNISEEEKNRIREQHTGGMKIATDKFKKLVEAKQGNVKLYLNEQLNDENGFMPSKPEPTQSEPTQSFWKPKFDNLISSLDSYFDTIEGPVDVKRFNAKLSNAFYQMRDESGLDAPINDEYQKLFNEFRSHFHSKLKDLVGKHGSN